MLMILRWSSSPHHTRKVLLLLWKIPRPVGQNLLAFAACRNLSPSCCKGSGWKSEDVFYCLEEEMIVNELVLDIFRHPRQWIVDALVVPSQSLEVVFFYSSQSS